MSEMFLVYSLAALFVIVLITMAAVLWIFGGTTIFEPPLPTIHDKTGSQADKAGMTFSYGDSCDDDSKCPCGKMQLDDDAKKICCPTDETIKYKDDSYCSNRKHTENCFVDGMCKSNSCGKMVGIDGKVCCHFGSVNGWCKQVEVSGTKVGHPKQCRSLEMFNGRCG